MKAFLIIELIGKAFFINLIKDMANIFETDPERLRETLKVLREKQNEFSYAYSNIYGAINGLQVNYQGFSSQALLEVFENYRDAFKVAEKKLIDFNDAIEKHISEVEKAEEQLYNQINSIN